MPRLSFFWLHMGRLRYILRNHTENTAFQAVVAQCFSCEDRLEDRGSMGLRVQLLPMWDFSENLLGSLVISRKVAQARSSRYFCRWHRAHVRIINVVFSRPPDATNHDIQQVLGRTRLPHVCRPSCQHRRRDSTAPRHDSWSVQHRGMLSGHSRWPPRVGARFCGSGLRHLCRGLAWSRPFSDAARLHDSLDERRPRCRSGAAARNRSIHPFGALRRGPYCLVTGRVDTASSAGDHWRSAGSTANLVGNLPQKAEALEAMAKDSESGLPISAPVDELFYVDLDFVQRQWFTGAQAPIGAAEHYYRMVVPESPRVINERFNIEGQGVGVSDVTLIGNRPILIVTPDSDPRHPRSLDAKTASLFGADFVWLADQGILGTGTC